MILKVKYELSRLDKRRTALLKLSVLYEPKIAGNHYSSKLKIFFDIYIYIYIK